MYICRDIKYLLFLLDFNETEIFWTDFRIILKRQIHVNLKTKINQQNAQINSGLIYY